MIGVDTNVLVYAADESDPRHERCRQLITAAANGSTDEGLCVTWSVVYEFLRVVTHPRVLRHPSPTTQAWAFVAAWTASPQIAVLGPGRGHAASAARMLAAPGVRGNIVHDANSAAVLVEHGVHRIYTFDQDLRRFPGLEVLDPLT